MQLMPIEADYLSMVSSIRASDFGRVAVLYGGVGSEREVSLTSGKAVFDALISQGVDAVLIDTEHGVIEQLLEGRFDRAFNVLHGPVGEDGTIAGLLALLNIPCTGSSLGSSALAMDKVRTKLIWQALGLPTPKFDLAYTRDEGERAIVQLGYPLVVKPLNQGSSVGVYVNLKEEASFWKAFDEVHKAYGPVLIEQYIVGSDYFVGLVGSRVLPSVRVKTEEAFYNYAAKYLVDTNEYISPGFEEAEKESQCSDLCAKAYQALGCSGWGRLDLRVDEQGRLWLLEANTIPGMTAHSLVPTAAKKALGIEFSTLVMAILSQTLHNKAPSEKKVICNAEKAC